METDHGSIDEAAGEEGGVESAPGEAGAPEPEGRRRIASYLVRVHLYAAEGENLVAQTNTEVEDLVKTELGYTYGSANVSVSAERLDK